MSVSVRPFGTLPSGAAVRAALGMPEVPVRAQRDACARLPARPASRLPDVLHSCNVTYDGNKVNPNSYFLSFTLRNSIRHASVTRATDARQHL